MIHEITVLLNYTSKLLNFTYEQTFNYSVPNLVSIFTRLGKYIYIRYNYYYILVQVRISLNTIVLSH